MAARLARTRWTPVERLLVAPHLDGEQVGSARERRPQKERFEATVVLIHEKLRLLGGRDHPPQYLSRNL